MIIVQHSHPLSSGILTGILRQHCKIRVKEAENGEPLWAGCVYVAPPGRHLKIAERGYITICDGAKVRYSRPSIDVLFSSAAECYGDRILGIILTGGNQDGADGAQLIHLLGGIVIAQQAAEYPRMPMAAVATGSVDHPLPLENIPSSIVALSIAPSAAFSMQRHA